MFRKFPFEDLCAEQFCYAILFVNLLKEILASNLVDKTPVTLKVISWL